MKIKRLYIPLFASLLFLASCSSPKKDARKAAKWTNKSIEQMCNMEIEESTVSFQKAQKIIRKYENKKSASRFYEYYREYRDKGKIPLKEKE